MRVTSRLRTVYRAPSTGREYMTLRAACMKEAGAMMERKYPRETATGTEFGDPTTAPGWHFTNDPHLALVRLRLARRLARQYRKATP